MALGQILAGNVIYAEDVRSEVDLVSTLFARKTGNETVNNSTALQNDNHLTLAVPASASFALQARLIVNTGAVPDFKLGWTFPTGLTMSLHYFEGSSPTSPATVLQGPGTETTVAALSGIGADQVVLVEGFVLVSSTPGTVTLQWAQNNANASDTVVKTNSYLKLTRVG